MTTIDQRILIPTPPEVVWEYISEIRNNPRWQAGCTGVTFLTSKVSGPGTRWRQTIDKSSEQVIEISAWYEGLGYQYTYVDGVPFRDGTGRIRLQEIPEGTVVQWTITYEMGGLLGGMRGSLGLNRKLETMMVASLKALWKQVNESGSAQRLREAKSLMRDAPDAEARANYKPRHTPVVDVRAEGEGDTHPPKPVLAPVLEQDSDAKYRPPAGHVIPEPPVAEDDTRPRHAATVEPAPAEPIRPRLSIHELVEDAEEPEFLQDMARFAPPSVEPPSMDDTQPIRVISDVGANSDPDFMDAFALDDADFAPAKAAEDNANIELERPERAQADANLTDEINALLAEPAQEPIKPASITDEFEALLVEPEAPQPAAKSITDEINALIAEPEPTDEAATVSAVPAEAEDFRFDDLTGETVPAVPVPPSATTAETIDAGPPSHQDETTISGPRIDESAFPPPSATDTSKMSIWEIFGVPRPSETAEISKVEAETVEAPKEAEPPAVETVEAPQEAESPAYEPVAEAQPEPAESAPEPQAMVGATTPEAVSADNMMIVEVIREVTGPARRTGLRLRQRSKLARVRRPE